MVHIALVGGVCSGKTTLAKALQRETLRRKKIKLQHLNMFILNAHIPLTLMHTTHEDLLSLSREAYVQKIISNYGIGLEPFSRSALIKYTERLMEHYGDDIVGELALRLAKPTGSIIENIPRATNIEYLKQQGVFIVGLSCKTGIQLERIKEKTEGRIGESQLERLVGETNEFYQVEESLYVADVVFNTNVVRSDTSARLQEILRYLNPRG